MATITETPGTQTWTGTSGDDTLVTDYYTSRYAIEIGPGDHFIGGAGTDTLLANAYEGIQNLSLSDFTQTTIDPDIEIFSGYGILTYAQVENFRSIAGGYVSVVGSGTLDLARTQVTQLLLDSGNHVVDLSANTHGVRVTAGGTNILTGSAYADDLSGDGTLSGGAGDDSLSGRGTLIGGTGNDTIVLASGSGAGNDVEGGTGNDTLSGTFAAGDYISGGAGTDSFSGAGDISGGAVDIESVTATSLRMTIAQFNYATSVAISGTLTLTGKGTVAIGPGKTAQTFVLGNDGSTLDLSAASQASYTVNFIYTATGGSGNDAILGSAYQDTLNGGAGDDILYGHAGNDTLYGGAGRDELHGGTGNDSLLIHQASDVVAGEIYDGGDGYDTLVVADGTALSAVTLTGIEAITGGSASLTAAQIDGLAITGASFSSTFTITTAGSVRIARDDDGAHFLLSAAGNAIDLSGTTGAAVVNGQQGNDRITGGAGWDTLNGGDGKDIIIGGAGNDIIAGGNGNDTLSGGSGIDHLSGGAGDDIFNDAIGYFVPGDTYDGGVGNDALVLSGITASTPTIDLTSAITSIERIDVGVGTALVTAAELDNATALSGNFTLTTGGAVSLAGVANGYYALTGNAATYTLSDSGNSIDLTGLNNGSAFVVGGAGADSITGGSLGALIASGGGGNDMIRGSTGADRLDGGGGNDILDGNGGIDTLTGGAGNDDFLFDTAIGTGSLATITDFTVGQDLFELDRSIFSQIGADGPFAAAAFALGTSAQTAADRIVYNSATGDIFYDPDGSGAAAQIRFAHVTAGTALTASSFFGVP